MTDPQVVEEYVRFSTKGGREFYECKVCRATGRDEPALGKTARQQAEAHFDKVASHFRAVAFIPPPKARRDTLFQWMKVEMAIYSQTETAAWIASQIAHGFYAAEIKDRDARIEALAEEVKELKRGRDSVRSEPA